MKKRSLKKWLAMLLTAVTVCSLAMPVTAAQVEGEITEEDDADDVVEGEITPVNEDDDQVVGEVETGVNADDNVVIAEDDKPYLALGENLSADQKATVLKLMGINAANLDDYNVVSITNKEEHQYLDEYLPAEKIGTRALSSVVIVKREKGNGLNISTKNINYCTVGMYKNALATAGLEDADIIVAGPSPISGTAALIGAMKAYSQMTGEPVDEESLDAAMNEIVVTGELANLIAGADDGEVEEFIAYVKQKVLEGGLKDESSIRKCIDDALKKYDFSMTDDEKNELTSVLLKISKLDIDVDSLLDQAKSLYDQIKNSDDAQGFFAKKPSCFAAACFRAGASRSLRKKRPRRYAQAMPHLFPCVTGARERGCSAVPPPNQRLLGAARVKPLKGMFLRVTLIRSGLRRILS